MINQRVWVFCVLLCLSATVAQAEIVMVGRDTSGNLVPSSSPNAGRNLNPDPAGVGEYVGKFGNGSAVTIGSQYLVTAAHVSASSTFTFNNGTATPTTYHMALAATHGELSVYKITDANLSFSVYAPLYDKSNEVGKDLISVGYGVGRGQEVDTPGTSTLAGWNWNNVQDGKQSWGTNTVDNIALDGNNSQYLAFGFDRKVDALGNVLNPDEVILSDHDSGGGTFIKDGGVWKLAGINDTISSFRVKAGGAFVDAVFDGRGFYSDDAGQTIPLGLPDPYPMSSYSVRLSQSQYQTFLAPFAGRTVPEPGSLALLATGFGIGALVLRRRRSAA